MSKTNTVMQLVELLWKKKLWWLVPMVTVFIILGLLIVATASSPISPFIYTLF
jgi:hypothetical protein